MKIEAVERDSVPGALPPGAALGRYQILQRIAMGGMAELYLARQTGDAGYEKIVALKRVLPHLTEDVEFVRMFLNEAKLAAGLDHSNIVHVVDFGSEGGEHFLVMEYVHGRSVQAILQAGAKTGTVPRDVALTIVYEVAAALHYAHERSGPDGRAIGLVHRDVSPTNVLVSFAGEVKLVDFGIAKATAQTRVTRSGAIKGKLSYMAPEQVRGEDVDRRADVFALAIVAYELLTGRRCFTAPGEFALINRVAAAKYERPRAADPDFPDALEAILARGLAALPEDRFQTAREFQRAIEGFAASAGHRLSRLALSEYLDLAFGQVAYPTTDILPRPPQRSALPSTPVTTQARPAARRRVSAVFVGAALAIGLGVGLGGPLVLSRDEPEPAATPDAEPVADDPSPVRSATPSPPPAEREPDAPQPAAESSPIDEEAPDLIIEDDEQPASPARAAGKRKKRPEKREPTEAAGDKAPEYLPPSRRGG